VSDLGEHRFAIAVSALTSRPVYLPAKGRWRTGDLIFDGGQRIDFATPLGTVPVLHRVTVD
jgi:alpha-glucosidase (family GH31 glycosyl hydrolase)